MDEIKSLNQDFELNNNDDKNYKDNAIFTKDVVKYYGNTFPYFSLEYTDTKLALRGVSFEIPQGECFVMLGSNGAGKSTLFKIMLSELFPTSGLVQVKGLNLNSRNIGTIRK